MLVACTELFSQQKISVLLHVNHNMFDY